MAGLFNLRIIFCSRNEIKYIHQNAFKDLRKLKVASFLKNKLSTFNEYCEQNLISPFNNTKNLDKLNLALNNISMFYKDWRDHGVLTFINLQNNSITSIQVNSLSSKNYFFLLVNYEK